MVVETTTQQKDGKTPSSPVDEKTKSTQTKCYGVKSYLHYFYENEGKIDAEYAYLIPPPTRRYPFCRPLVWKATIWVGINFLVFGLIAILVAFLIPQKPVKLSTGSENYVLKDNAALTHNNNLEILKLVGQLTFTFGGVIVIIGLLVPTLFHSYCMGRIQPGEDGFRIRIFGESDTPLSMASPINNLNTTVGGVQPERKQKESIVTNSGMREMSAQ